MSDTICYICKHDFKTITKLKRHQQCKYKCNTKSYIKKNALNTNEYNKNLLISKNIMYENNYFQKKELAILIKKYVKFTNDKNSLIKIKEIYDNINNQIASNIDKKFKHKSNTTNNIKNSTDIKDKIQEKPNINISPFSLETISHININDIKNIFLQNDNILCKLLDFVYYKCIDNINFYKNNLNKNIIIYISKNIKKEIITENEFINILIENIGEISIKLYNILKDNLNEDEILVFDNNFFEYQKKINIKKDKTIIKNIKLFLDSVFRNKEIRNKLKNIKID